MKTLRPLVALSVMGLTACSASFSNPPPAQWHKPLRDLTTHIKATPPTFVIPALRAEGLTDAQVIDADLLIELVEIAPTSDLLFDTRPRSGPLVRINPHTGEVRWRVERAADERWTQLSRTASTLTFTQTLAKEQHIARLELSNGQITRLLKLPTAARVQRLGERTYILEVVAAKQDKAAKQLKITAYEALDQPPRWEVTYALPDGALYAVGGSLLLWGTTERLALDPTTGAQRARIAHTPSEASHAPLITSREQLLALRVGADRRAQLVAIGADGAERWSADHDALLGIDGEQLVVRRAGHIEALDQGGASRWRVPFEGEESGRVALLGEASAMTIFAPQVDGLVALDARGAQRFKLKPPSGQAAGLRAHDLAWCEGEERCFWDTSAGVTAFKPSGEVLYRFDVRSMRHVTRESRHWQLVRAQPAASSYTYSSPAIYTNTGGLMMASVQLSAATAQYLDAMAQINGMILDAAFIARSAALNALARRYAQEMMRGPYIIKRISWELGEGVLLIRKADGAFAEIVLGPSDAYSDAWRLEPLIALTPDHQTLITAHTGNDPTRWAAPVEVRPGEVIPREIMGFRLDALQWRPHSDYAAASVVPDGSY